MPVKPLQSLLSHLSRRDRSGPASDRELLAAYAADRDEAAFAELVRRHAAMVRGVARRLTGDLHAAEDVCQAAFLVLARRAAAGGWRESVGGWLHGVAFRLGCKARAAARRTPAPAGCPDRPADPPAADAADLRTLLDEELRRMPAGYRAALVLCYLEGLARDEAARRLGVSMAAVKGRLERGRELLRARLERRGCCLAVGLTAAALAEAPEALSAECVGRLTAVAAGAAAVPEVVARLAEGALPLAGPGRWALTAVAALALAGAAIGLSVPRPAVEAPEPPANPLPAARPDRFGDPIPAGAVARFGTLRWRAGGTTNQVAFSHDGALVVCASSGGVEFFDGTTGRPLDRRLAAPTGPVSGVALSPDGKLLATGSIGRAMSKVRLWDAATGKELPFPKQDFRALELTFAPDGTALAARGVDGSEAALWEIPSGRLIARLDHDRPADRPRVKEVLNIRWLAFSPDGKTLYSADNYHPDVNIWDAGTGQLRRTFPYTDQRDVALALSPDGATLVVGERGNVALRDPETGQVLRSFRGPEQPYALAFTDGGKLLAALEWGGINFYDLATHERKRAVNIVTTNPRHQGGSLYASPDGSRLALSFAGSNLLQVWDAATGKPLADSSGHRAAVASLAIEDDGRTLLSIAADGDPTIRRWDLAAGQALEDSRLMIPDQREQSERRAAAFAPGGKLLALAGMHVSSDGRRGVNPRWEGWADAFSATGREPHRSLLGVKDAVNHIAWSADGALLATAGQDKTVRVWEFATGKELRAMAGEAGIVLALAFAPDGKTLAAAGTRPREEAAVLLWDVTTGQELRRFAAGKHASVCLAFSPDGRALATGDGSGVRLWDVATGKELRALAGPVAGVTACAFTPDGKSVVAGDRDGSLCAWESATGREALHHPGHRHAVTALALTPDGRTAVTGSEDTTILVWQLR
jgi:RNA polymerase sigma factor (sigma-70 family)